ncbi:MAG: hypothetical protein ACREMB_14825 [Candidatus Rokuibacteriota bacterium]
MRLPEGNTRGFLVLRSLEGEAIAHGELRQKPVGGAIESVLALHFEDGSVLEEVATFTQKDFFRLEGYRLVQRGPSFPTLEVSFDRKSGRYRAVTQEKKEDEERSANGPLEMPADLYNGMALVLLKNLSPGTRASVQMAAFTPKPTLIKMEMGPEGEERVSIGGQARKVTRYLVNLDVGGLTGALASLVGKEPPDLRYWLVTGEVPAFVKFRGAMFLNGPVWRLEMTTVEWPK